MVRVRIFVEPQQGASYDQLLAVARETEAGGFDALFRSDHFLTMGGDGLPGPTDAWVTLGGLARETSRIRLGTLVTSATFRLPGVLAIEVAQVDAMSGGRVEIGLGAGWYDAEHTAYGVPFPPVGERFERLEEQFQILEGLWGTPEGETFSFEGRHYQLKDSPALPKPVQRPHPPIIVGGGGPTSTPRLAATYADEFNLPFSSLADTEAQFGRVRAACEARGRDPKSLRLSAAQVVCCGSDEAELTRPGESHRAPGRRAAGQRGRRDARRGGQAAARLRRHRRRDHLPPGVGPQRSGAHCAAGPRRLALCGRRGARGREHEAMTITTRGAVGPTEAASWRAPLRRRRPAMSTQAALDAIVGAVAAKKSEWAATPAAAAGRPARPDPARHRGRAGRLAG